MYTLYYFNGINYQDITAFCISPKLVHAANIGDMSLDFEFIGPSNISIEWLKLDSIARIFVVKRGTIIFSGRLSNVILHSEATKVQCKGLFSLFGDFGSFGVLASTTDRSLFKKQTVDHRDFNANFATNSITIEENIFSIRPVKGEGISNLAANGFFMPMPLARVNVSGNLYAFTDISFSMPSGFIAYVRQFDNDDNSISTATVAVVANTTARRVFVNYAAVSGIADHVVCLRNSTGGTYTSTQDTGFWYANINNTRLALENDVRFTTATINVTAGSTITITPASMTNIYNGQRLYVVSGTYTTANTAYTGESIVVSGMTATTFRGTFATSIHGSSTIIVPFVTPKTIFDGYATVAGLDVDAVTDVNIDISDALFDNTTFENLCNYIAKRGDGTKKHYYGVDSLGNFYYKPASSSTYYIDVESFELSATIDDIYNRIIPISKRADGTLKELNPVVDQSSVERINKARTAVYTTDTTYDPQATVYAMAYLEDSIKGSVNTVISIVRAYNTLGAAVSLDILNPGDIVIPRNIPISLTTTAQSQYTIDTKQVFLDSGKIVFSFDKPLSKIEALVNFI